MKLWLYALAMCQSMFCAIPFPWNLWEEKARDRMLLCLPFIGLEIGAIWWGISLLCSLLPLPGPLMGFALCAAPFLLTGFLHLDGFMDVTDAVRSYRSLERRREILKDSHVGSFAVIGAALVLLGQYAAAAAIPGGADLRILILIPMVSRCCSVLAIQVLPPMTTSQYANREKHIAFPGVVLLAAVGCGFLMGVTSGLVLICCAAGFGIALRRAYKSLQGMNGDISGYCITLSELAGLICLALCSH